MISRTFSNRYVSMDASASVPFDANRSLMNFPNLDELSFQCIRAFLNDSGMGLDCSTCYSMLKLSDMRGSRVFFLLAMAFGVAFPPFACASTLL